MTTEELAQLFETASERLGRLMLSIADPAKLRGYADANGIGQYGNLTQHFHEVDTGTLSNPNPGIASSYSGPTTML